MKRMMTLVALRDLSVHAQGRASAPPPKLLRDQTQGESSVDARKAWMASDERRPPAGSPALSPDHSRGWNRHVFHHGSLAAATGMAHLLGVRTYRRHSEMTKTDSSFDQLV